MPIPAVTPTGLKSGGVTGDRLYRRRLKTEHFRRNRPVFWRRPQAQKISCQSLLPRLQPHLRAHLRLLPPGFCPMTPMTPAAAN